MQNQQPLQVTKTNSQRKLMGIFFAFSLTIHIPLLWLAMDPVQKQALLDKVDNEKIIKLVLQGKKAKIKDQQVVNNEKRGEEIEPENSKYLGERNQKVEKETTQKDIGIFKIAGQGVADGSDAPKEASANQRVKKVVKKDTLKTKEKITFADLAPAVEMLKKKTSTQFNKAPKGLKKGDKETTGMGRNNDYIEDVPLGDMTALNTVEFKYFGFYHRIRLQLEQHWGKSLKEQVENLYRTGRKIASGEDKITALVITLDHKGQILDVHVKGSSGISELDRAAIEAFNRAGPFPNPPKGMLSNGLAEIEWGFVVKS